MKRSGQLQVRLETETECSFKGVLAGVRILSNRPLVETPQNGFADLEVRIHFVDASSAEMMLPPDSYALPAATGTKGWISASGRCSVLAEKPGQATDQAVRGVLPFASAIQGAVVLHGSAVATPCGIHAFIAASGTGKSTLAASLVALGLPLVADDLTACRFGSGTVTVPLPDELTADRVNPALIAVHFLARRAGIDRPVFTPLPPARCIELLLWNGFSELESRPIWALQFRRYEQIARQVPAFTLEIPDDLARITRTAAEVHAAIGRILQPRISGR